MSDTPNVEDLKSLAAKLHEHWGDCLWIDASELMALEKAIAFNEDAPVAQTVPRLKDNEIAQLVNELRDIAVKFHAAQQLREQIAYAVVPALKGERKPNDTHARVRNLHNQLFNRTKE